MKKMVWTTMMAIQRGRRDIVVDGLGAPLEGRAGDLPLEVGLCVSVGANQELELAEMASSDTDEAFAHHSAEAGALAHTLTVSPKSVTLSCQWRTGVFCVLEHTQTIESAHGRHHGWGRDPCAFALSCLLLYLLHASRTHVQLA